MDTYDRDAKAMFIAGLRDLADFLTAHPDVPVPEHSPFYVFPAGATEVDRRAEVDGIAAYLGVLATGQDHYVARRGFGPIQFEAVALSDSAIAAHRALMTYRNNFTGSAAEPSKPKAA